MTSASSTLSPRQVVCIATAPDAVARVREVLRTHLPGTELVEHPGDALTVDGIPTAACAIIAGGSGRDALEIVRKLRAGGYGAAIVLVADDWTAELRAGAGQVGTAHCVERREISTALAPAVASAMRTGGERDAAAIDAELRRTQRLIAAGEIALALQHDLNNPLAGILAESQLLEMEELPPEQHEAVQRIVNLCRRLIVLVRRLDGVSESGHR